MNRFGLYYLVIIVFFSTQVNAQLLGGGRSFSFVELPVSARLTALSENLGVRDGDNNLAYRNPSLLNPKMDKQLSFSTLYHFGDVRSYFFNYSQYIESWKITWHGGVNYVDYGDFTRTDTRGVDLGTFEATDISYHIGASYQLYERMSIGANIKYLNSSYDRYSAGAIAMDLAATYFIEEKRMSIALTINNYGAMLNEFTENSNSKLPLNIQLAYTKRFEHLPFRYSIIYHHLQAWDLEYSDPDVRNSGSIFINNEQADDGFGTNLLKHIIVNAELLLGAKETLVLRASYNFLRRQELKLANYGGTMGLSIGVGIRVNRFRIDYGRAIYHQAGASNHLSFSTNINSFRKETVLK